MRATRVRDGCGLPTSPSTPTFARLIPAMGRRGWTLPRALERSACDVVMDTPPRNPLRGWHNLAHRAHLRWLLRQSGDRIAPARSKRPHATRALEERGG